MFCRSLAGYEYYAPYQYKKSLDVDQRVCHIVIMAIHIVKIDRNNQIFRLVIPHTIIKLKRWHDVRYVTVDDSCEGRLIIRRFVDGKALKTDS